ADKIIVHITYRTNAFFIDLPEKYRSDELFEKCLLLFRKMKVRIQATIVKESSKANLQMSDII
ncbi:MAG: hypothetical protein KA247_05705, partial [Bacteroidetes bacterium]|nr:hypothetical protein [Bacteroidota bacterium]